MLAEGDPERPKTRVATGPRVGISKAAALPYRFFEADANGRASRWVSAFRPGRTEKRA